MQRFVHAMTNGHPIEAIRYNAFLPLLIFYVMLFALERLVLTGHARMRLREAVEGRAMCLSLAAAIPIWFVLRNLLGI